MIKSRGQITLEKYVKSSGKFTILAAYKSYKSPILIKCNVCEYEWETTSKSIQTGIDCICCTGRVWDTKKMQNYLDENSKNIQIVSEYCGSQSPVDCQCKVCGYVWTCSPDNLKRNNSGCPVCNRKGNGSTENLQKMFDDNGHKVSVVGNYVNNSTPVKCECDACGEVFYPTAATVMYGSGCPFCCFKGAVPNVPARLYYVRISTEEGTYWKVGITTKPNIVNRFPNGERKHIKVLYSFLFDSGESAYRAEKDILRLYKAFLLPKGVKILETGNTEIFTHDVLQMDHLANKRMS